LSGNSFFLSVMRGSEEEEEDYEEEEEEEKEGTFRWGERVGVEVEKGKKKLTFKNF